MKKLLYSECIFLMEAWGDRLTRLGVDQKKNPTLPSYDRQSAKHQSSEM